jgi:hypothetical protein
VFGACFSKVDVAVSKGLHTGRCYRKVTATAVHGSDFSIFITIKPCFMKSKDNLRVFFRKTDEIKVFHVLI